MPSFNKDRRCMDCKYIDYCGGTWVCMQQVQEDMREYKELGEPTKVYTKACLFFEEKEEGD